MKANLMIATMILVSLCHPAHAKKCSAEELELDKAWSSPLCTDNIKMGREAGRAAERQDIEAFGKLKQQLLQYHSDLQISERLWRKGSINPSHELLRILSTIRGLPEVPDGLLISAKTACAAAAQSLSNAMSSAIDRDRANNLATYQRWERSRVADLQEFRRYSTECSHAARRAAPPRPGRAKPEG